MTLCDRSADAICGCVLPPCAQLLLRPTLGRAACMRASHLVAPVDALVAGSMLDRKQVRDQFCARVRTALQKSAGGQETAGACRAQGVGSRPPVPGEVRASATARTVMRTASRREKFNTVLNSTSVGAACTRGIAFYLSKKYTTVNKPPHGHVKK